MTFSGEPTSCGFRLFALLVLLAASLNVSIWAQNAARLSGDVVDSTNAIVSGAHVRLVNEETNQVRSTLSNGSGLYLFPEIQPGRYRLEVSLEGFKRFVSTGLKIEVDQQARLDVVLAVGAVEQTVTVDASNDILDTDNGSMSEVVQGRQVEDMPLNVRNTMDLLGLVPGVVPQGGTGGPAIGNNAQYNTNQGVWGNYQIAGSLPGNSSTLIDGISDQEPYLQNYTVVNPTQDSVQEFRVDSNASAEFGGFNGGVISMTTRSGTNRFHGTAYEYLRNKVLNQNYFFDQKNGIAKPQFTQNQYGLAVGGAAIKNKTFFFFSWEAFSQRTAQPETLTVPTALMRTGNFSEVSNPIYDPCGGTVTAGQGCPNYSGPRTPIPGNVIPTQLIDPTAEALLNYWPAPQLTGIVNNYLTNAASGSNSNEYVARVDHNLTQSQHLFFRYTDMRPNGPAVDPFHTHTGTEYSNNLGIQAVLGYTWTINTKTLFDARLAWIRSDFVYTPDNPFSTSLSQLGPNWSSIESQFEFLQTPPVTISGGYTSTDVIEPMDGAQTHHMEDGVASASLTRIQGANTLKFGGSYRKGHRFPALVIGNESGSFSFDNGFTAATPNSTGTSGYGFASFMMGYASGGSWGYTNPVDEILSSWAIYGTDIVQIRRLTLNLGLRWDQPGATKEGKNLDGVLLLNAPDPLGSIVNPVTQESQQLTGQYTLVDTAAYPSVYERYRQWDILSPRFGFAYDVGHNTSIRGGLGIFFLPSGISGLGPRSAPSNTSTTTMAASLNGGLTPNAVLSDPLKGTTFIYPIDRNVSELSSLEGQDFGATLPNLAFAYSEQWNLNIQHKFGTNAVAQLGYDGQRGLHLEQLFPSEDQIPDQYDSLGSALLNPVANPFYGVLPAGSGPLAGPTVPLGQLLRPYPQYEGLGANFDMKRPLSYNALLASFQERFKGGGTLLASYSFQKQLSSTDSTFGFFADQQWGFPQDWTNPRGDYSETSFDIPNRLVVSYVTDLPFGRGKRYLNSLNGVGDKVISGWGINGISTFQSGFPLYLQALPTVLSTNFGAGSPRPNVTPGCKKSVGGSAGSRLSEWFNTGCFSQPSAYGFGKESRTDPHVRSQGRDNWDFAATKTTSIHEALSLEFNAEFFNLFNRTEFSIPGATVGTPTFGVVSGQSNEPRLIQFALRLRY
jgi:Carboxypeptidase regulatory-like domain